MRLENTEPKGHASREWAGGVKAQKQHETEQREDRSLPREDANHGWGKRQAQPMKVVVRTTVHSTENPNRACEAGDEKQGPQKRPHTHADVSQRKHEREG